MKTGLDRLSREMLPGSSVGLLSHYAAVNRKYESALDVLAGMPGIDLRMVMGPQHGFFGETQDNMIEWEGYSHPEFGIPVYSLYGRTREPEPYMLDGLDCLVVDLQDVGSRYYTYIYTMAYCLRACSSAGIPVVVLDRPNPLGLSIVEGRRLEEGYESFVGMYQIPVRHGLTIGELSRLFCMFDSLEKPKVVGIEGWDFDWLNPGYPWVFPSPNMPDPGTALVYAGMCLLEATNISEGRGTTRPFRVFGAPWLDGYRISRRLNGTVWLEGAFLRPHAFLPTFNKHQGELCHGCEIHVVDRDSFRPFRAALGILLELFEYSSTRWNDPPYEYEYSRMPVDILTGSHHVRQAVEGRNGSELMELSSCDVGRYRSQVEEALIYRREFES
jgi:uncharacterized protein YbbC (DUF1343 family)